MKEPNLAAPSICIHCGFRGLIWGNNPDGSWHPPLVERGSAFVLVDEVVRHQTLYDLHRCQPEDALEWDRSRSGADAKGRKQHREALDAMQRDARAQAYSRALPQPCPTCKVEPGKPCRNLAGRNSFGIAMGHEPVPRGTKEKLWPHWERYPEFRRYSPEGGVT